MLVRGIGHPVERDTTMQIRSRVATRAAFSLMEVLVVVAIIAILAGTGTVIYLRYIDETNVKVARTGVLTLGKVADTFKLNTGRYPTTLAELTQPTADGNKPYVEPNALVDPWGHEYQYAAEGQRNAAYGRPDIWSLGPRPGDSNAIIGNWPISAGVGGH